MKMRLTVDHVYDVDPENYETENAWAIAKFEEEQGLDVVEMETPSVKVEPIARTCECCGNPLPAFN